MEERGGEKKKGYAKIKETRGNKISPGTPFSSHERAKLVLFYNPSASPRAPEGQEGGEFRRRLGAAPVERRERRWMVAGILLDGWTNLEEGARVAEKAERLSTSVLKVCDSLQIGSLSSF